MAARIPLALLSLLTILNGALAYIPALATNDTSAAIQGGLNVTDVSKLHLQWYSNGSYWENVSYQLVGADSQGISQGALVHFSETNVTNATTTTPWIALVACDFNATNASQEDDIFTLARDRGAVAALLYSLYSAACVINPAYADPATFDQVMDIFSTQSLTSAHLIDYQFGQFGAQNESLYGSFDAQRLNESAAEINETMQTGAAVAPGYLFATLQAYNATGPGSNDTNDPNDPNSNPTSSNSGGSTNTGLAMIILYAITGCVSALFCIVIISGAIRAIRHPERYGPRPGLNDGGGGGGQSRARGLTRAILETFPVVKFGQNTTDRNLTTQDLQDVKDLESHPPESRPNSHGIEMRDWEVLNTLPAGDDGPHLASERPISIVSRDGEAFKSPQIVGEEHPTASGSNTARATTAIARPPAEVRKPSEQKEDVVPAAIGRETCPICIVDFEEGDDLRQLPCEGKHRFHQQCVDPWLLELSSSCPICRQDFHALETMMSRDTFDGAHEHHFGNHENPRDSAALGNRFSRYLRFARRRRHRAEYDPTDPYMPVAHESVL